MGTHMGPVARGAAFIAVLVPAFAGCSRGVGATASGTVTYDGKPVPAGVVVRFQPQVPGSSSSLGVTDADGRYDLRFNANVRGVLPGDSVVSFALRESYGANGAPFIPKELRAIRIPASASGHASGLVKKVRPGGNVIDIEITEAGGR
jgi:hypothetical protein